LLLPLKKASRNKQSKIRLTILRWLLNRKVKSVYNSIVLRS